MLPVGSDPLLHRHTPKTVPLCNRLIALLPRLVTLHYGQFELFIVLRHEKHPKGWIGVQLLGCSSYCGRSSMCVPRALTELDRAANDSQPKPQVAISSISRGSDKAGFCRSEPPFKARRVSDITASLRNQLAGERYHFEQGNEDEWRRSVKSIAAALRDTWEIAVEEVVGHVIRRLSNEVKTPGLVKLTAITVPDCE